MTAQYIWIFTALRVVPQKDLILRCCFIHLKNLCKALYKFFKALKTSEFNIEDTHLTDIERVRKLFSLVLIAFVWVYRDGIYLDALKPIKIKKHGRRAKSFFKYGLNHIANLLFSIDIDKFTRCCKFLSCT